MNEPCIISGKRGVKTLFNQPDVPAAAYLQREAATWDLSHERVPVVSEASGCTNCFFQALTDRLRLTGTAWIAQFTSPHPVGFSVSEAQPPATWPFRGIFTARNVLSGSFNPLLSFRKIIKHSNQANKAILITFALESGCYWSLVWGSGPTEFAKAGLTFAVNVEITRSKIFITPQRSWKYS